MVRGTKGYWAKFTCLQRNSVPFSLAYVFSAEMEGTHLSTLSEDFFGGLVAKTPRSQCRGPRFDPWSGKEIPHAATKSLPASTKRCPVPQLRPGPAEKQTTKHSPETPLKWQEAFWGLGFFLRYKLTRMKKIGEKVTAAETWKLQDKCRNGSCLCWPRGCLLSQQGDGRQRKARLPSAEGGASGAEKREVLQRC